MKARSILTFFVVLGVALVPGAWDIQAQEALVLGKAQMRLGEVSGEIAVGDLFTVPVLVEPNGEKLDTMRLSLSFSPETLEAVYFQLGTLFPVISPGASLDNLKGIIYYGGFKIGDSVTKNGVLGIATFKAKKAGQGEIGLTKETLLYGAGEIKSGPFYLQTVVLDIKEPVGPSEDVPFIIQSVSHPEQGKWYANSKVEISWTAKPGIKEFFFAFDQSAKTKASDSLPGEAVGPSQMIFENTANGLNYFHLKTRVNGKDSNTVHYPVLVDTASPVFLPSSWDKQELPQGQTTRLNFSATDLDSGLDYYQATQDGKDLGKVKSPLEVIGEKLGENILEIKAFDRAGNSAMIREKFLTRQATGKTNWTKVSLGGGAVLIVGILIFLNFRKKRK